MEINNGMKNIKMYLSTIKNEGIDSFSLSSVQKFHLLM